MTTTPQTLSLAGEDYVLIPRGEYERLRAAPDEDAADVGVIRRVLDDPDETWAPAQTPTPHCRRGTPRARPAHPPRHDRPLPGRRPPASRAPISLP